MADNLNITLTGIQQDENGERDANTINAPAEYYERNGTHYIFFEEKDPETGATVKSAIKYKNQILELTKKGNINTRMVFEAGKEFLSDYITPFGHLQMSISTHSVECHFKKGLPQIRASYALFNEGQKISDSIIIVKLSKSN